MRALPHLVQSPQITVNKSLHINAPDISRHILLNLLLRLSAQFSHLDMGSCSVRQRYVFLSAQDMRKGTVLSVSAAVLRGQCAFIY